MRKLVIVALSAMCVAGTASIAAAQGGGRTGGGGGFNAMTAINRWLTTPDTIKVSADLQKKIDDLAGKFADERLKAAADTSNPGGRAARNAELTTKYQGLVRALLPAADQATFDKNIAALAAMRGGRRGGN
jgi:hypothetical protein